MFMFMFMFKFMFMFMFIFLFMFIVIFYLPDSSIHIFIVCAVSLLLMLSYTLLCQLCP